VRDNNFGEYGQGKRVLDVERLIDNCGDFAWVEVG
jgi:hypothetical protein